MTDDEDISLDDTLRVCQELEMAVADAFPNSSSKALQRAVANIFIVLGNLDEPGFTRLLLASWTEHNDRRH